MNLLNRVFGAPSDVEAPKVSQSLTIVPLAEAALPQETWLREELAKPIHRFRHFSGEKISQVIKQLAARDPAQDREAADSVLNMLAPISLPGCKFESQNVSLTLAGLRSGVEAELGFATVALLPTPVPGRELYDACARSWRWPDAAVALRPHSHHWVIVVATSTTPFQNACIALRLLGALSSFPAFLGAYFGSAGLVHSPAFLRAREDTDASTSPVNYWVNMATVAHEDGTHTFYTRGLPQFRAPEIEIVRSRLAYEALYERGRGLADYVMKAGPVLRHGDSIGATAAEKIQVRHEPSVFNLEQTVCRVHL
jgi:hypothetical protein